ncbi:RNA polymerase sigma-70 factor [Phaeodactylibacter sp.]|uniref:RNA polymerase sigma-70 factor n=1 Tax=Phaeodactylibacter sp. TaxID=1940289 RepID=UPI0025DBD373|nr:RNA polymerase sigma-70 factor [Phaeodactylibacter sp.]MCI4648844.1 RNA polymerase sigma-70 factor [Phaeodactylibacter sp.]MCI5093918.1 RNA polymerase sigma-70 factor [Phaeodactylibacter sp.]
MSDNTEINLLSRLKADDRMALQHLFEDHYEMVCQSIYRFVPDASTAEDLAQEVFLRFWEKRHKIEINSSLGAYIRRMAINEGLGYLRRNKRWEQEAFEPGHEPGVDDSAEEQFLHEEMQANVTAAINQLPPKCRTVFQLSRYEELTYKEIAEQMDISVKTVENQMGKALRVLREKLQHYLQIALLFGLLWCTACQPAEAFPPLQHDTNLMEYTAFRLTPGMDLKGALQEWADTNDVEAAVILSAVGSLTDYAIRFANQSEASIGQGHFEITGMTGTLSKNGSHLHLTVADETGQCLGGHLMDGCRIYTTAEIVIGLLPDYEFLRVTDETYGYKELEVKKKKKN